jgi:hypothetical protein
MISTDPNFRTDVTESFKKNEKFKKYNGNLFFF